MDRPPRLRLRAAPLAISALLGLVLWSLGSSLAASLLGWGGACSPADGGAADSVVEVAAQLEARVAALARVLAPLDARLAGDAQHGSDARGDGDATLLFSWVDGSGGSMFRAAPRHPLAAVRAASDRLATITAVLAGGGGEKGDAAGHDAGTGVGSSTLVQRVLEAAQRSAVAFTGDAPSLASTAALPPMVDNASAGGDGGVAAPRCPPCYGFMRPSAAACRCPSASRCPSAAPWPSASSCANTSKRRATAADSSTVMRHGLSGYDRSAQPAGDAWFVTYGDDNFERSRARLAREAAGFKGVFQHVLPLGRADLNPRWVAAHAKLLSAPRGGGYWVWKPHVLLRVLTERMQDGDVLLYADAGCTFVADPTPYLELAATHGLVLFRGRNAMHTWTKGYTFVAAGMDMQQWGAEGQVIGGIIALQKRPWVVAFLLEWLRLMTDDPRVVNDDDTSRLAPDHPSFQEHRHDQSVLSLLAYKHGVFTAPYRSWPKEKAYILATVRSRG